MRTQKNLWKKICPALLLACLLICVPILLQANRIQAYAAENTLLVTQDAFESVRQHVQDHLRNYGTYDLETFVDESFQLNENNFDHISAANIKNLPDPRYPGVNLGQEADAIRVNKTQGNVLTKKNISAIPNITVLTSGQGGLVSHWSNPSMNSTGADWVTYHLDPKYNDAAIAVCGDSDPDCPHHNGGICKQNAVFKFTRNPDSLIEQLRQAGDADVYIARSNIYKSYADGIINPDTKLNERRNTFRYDYSNFEVELSSPVGGVNPPLLSLYKLTDTDNSYTKYDPDQMFAANPYPNDPNITLRTHVDNYTKHNIIIFESDDAQQYHEYVYNQLAAILVQISYDYLQTTHQIPKFNMVSHSTGGNWNAMFASRFPFNVEKLVTYDAPLFGSKLGRLLYDCWPGIKGTVLEDIFTGTYNMAIVPSGFNNIDIYDTHNAETGAVTRYCRMSKLQADWNAAAAVDVNPSLQLVALSGFTEMHYLVDALSEDALLAFMTNFLSTPEGIAKAISILYVGATLAGMVGGMVFGASFGSFFGPLGTKIGTGIGGIIGTIYANSLVNTLLDAVDPIVAYITDSLEANVDGTYTLRDSFFIAEESSTAAGYTNVKRANFGIPGMPDEPYQHVYTTHNSYSIPLSVKNKANPHNLIAQDPWAAGVVLDNLTLESHPFELEISGYNAVITGLKYNLFGELIIPEVLNGYVVCGIADGAFLDRTGITRVSIPDTVTAIGANVFDGCENLAAIDMAENAKYMSRDGILYKKTPAVSFVHIPKNLSGSVTIPHGITAIPDEAFMRRSYLTVINFPTSVQSIGNYAFAESGLSAVIIPQNVVSIGAYAFYGMERLRQVVFESGSLLTSIGDHAFEDNIYLDSVVIPSGVTHIGERAFSHCNVTGITFERGSQLTSIGKRAFAENDITRITVPASVTDIGEKAFYGCSQLKKVYLERPLSSGVIALGADAFYITGLTDIYVPDASSVTAYKAADHWSDYAAFIKQVPVTAGLSFTLSGDGTYYTVAKGTANTNGYVFIPSTYNNKPVKGIDNNGFALCMNLTGVEFVGSFADFTIGALAFDRCYYLADLVLPHGTASIEAMAFNTCLGLTEIIIPDSVQTIGYAAFSDCINAANLVIGSGVTTIADDAFGGCSGLNTVSVDEWNTAFWSSGNCLVRAADNVLLQGANYAAIPYGITGIGTRAFSYMTLTWDFAIPETVTHIGDGAFKGSSLTEISIPAGVTSVGYEVFSQCYDLSSVAFEPNSQLTELSGSMFAFCYSLTQIEIPAGVTYIDSYVFLESAITSLEIPANVTSIHPYAFYGCGSLANLSVASGNPVYRSSGDCILRKADNTVVFGCSDSVIPSDAPAIDAYAFFGMYGLLNITIPGNITSIGEFAFYHCSNLSGVTISNNVAAIGTSAFYSWSGSLTIYAEPASKPAGWDMSDYINDCPIVWGCTLSQDKTYVVSFAKTANSMTNSFVAGDISAPYRAGHTFGGWNTAMDGSGTTYPLTNGAQYSVIPNGTILYAVWHAPFAPTANLSYTLVDNSYYKVSKGSANTNGVVYIPAMYNGLPVTEIASDGFKNCTGLTAVVFQSGSQLTTIGANAFNGCTNLASINLPDTMTEIGEYAFKNTAFFTAAANNSVVYASGWVVGVKGAVTTATVADGTRGLTNRAFYKQTTLTSITLPNSLRYIGERSFDKAALVNLVIPEGVVYVGSRALESVTTLVSVLIPSTAEVVRGYTFTGCTGLTTVYVHRPSASGVTGIQVSTFNGCSSLTNIYIDDANSVSTYKTAFGWKSYASKISLAP